MIYVKKVLGLSMWFLASSLSYFPFFITNRYFLQTKRFWDTRVCFPYVCLCLLLNQKLLMKCQLILLEREQQEMILVWYQLYPHQCRLIKSYFANITLKIKSIILRRIDLTINHT